MSQVKITGMELVCEPIPNKQGNTALAFFSADIGMFSLRGCILMRTARQGLAAWLPRLDDARAHNNRSVTLKDDLTRNAMLKAAREMYIRMGGSEADYPSQYGGEGKGLHPFRGCDERGFPTHPSHFNYTAPDNEEEDDREALDAILASRTVTQK